MRLSFNHQQLPIVIDLACFLTIFVLVMFLTALAWKFFHSMQAAQDALQEEARKRTQAEAAFTTLHGEMVGQKGELEGFAQSLAQASSRFQEMFQGLPVACFCYDRQGRIMEWNRAFERLYGLNNILGRSIWDTVYSREEAPQIADAIAAVLEGEPQEGIEWTHRRADGSLASLYCSILPMRGVHGEVTGGISADVDISAQQEAEDALRASEERLHTLYNTTSQQALTFEEKTEALLQTGREHFNLEIGVLAQTDGENLEVVQALSPGSVIAPGAALPADANYGRAALEYVHGDAGADAEVSLGSPIRVNGELWGTLFFAGCQPEAKLFTSGDREMVRLMAQWIGGEVARRQAEEAVRESEERFRSAIASMSEGLVLMDSEGVIRICNESAERILGVAQSAIQEYRPLNSEYVIRREDGTPFPEGCYPLVVALKSGKPQRDIVAGLPQQGGGMLWVSINSTPLFQPGSGTPSGATVTFADITERRRHAAQIAAQVVQIQDYAAELEAQKLQLEDANTQLEILALQDGLTGLGNRRAFEWQMEQELLRAERHHLPLSLALLDVDAFKDYNDEFGHPAGDVVLQILAREMEKQGRETDFFARFGGEEFVILLPHTDSQGAISFAERLRAALEYAAWPGRSLTVSIGVATLTPSMQNQAELVSAADMALYAAKEAGRNRVVHAQAFPSQSAPQLFAIV